MIPDRVKIGPLIRLYTSFIVYVKWQKVKLATELSVVARDVGGNGSFRVGKSASGALPVVKGLTSRDIGW